MKVTLMLNEDHYRQFPRGSEILEKANKNRTGINICSFYKGSYQCYAFVQTDSGKTYYIMIISDNDNTLKNGVAAVRDCDKWNVSTMGFTTVNLRTTQIVKRENEKSGMDIVKDSVSDYFDIDEIQQAIHETIKEYNAANKQ